MFLVRKIHFAVYGSGLGHASRMSLIAKFMKDQGDTINFSSFDYAVDYIREKGFNCDVVPPLDIEWRNEGVSAKNILGDIPILLSNFVLQVRKEKQIMNRFRPDIVVSDTRLSAVVAAYIMGVPSITITNQLRILLPPKFHTRKLSKMELVVAETLGLLWSQSQHILVPDIPLPFTVSKDNTVGIKTTKNKIKYVGFMSPTSIVSEKQLAKVSEVLEFNKEKPIVFAQISGPSGTKRKLSEIIIKVAETLSDKFIFVISKGQVGGEDKPRKIRGGWIYEWCPIKDELFTLSDVLLIRGGHTTISQAILYGKPLVTIPIRNHSEQLANSLRVSEIGFGKIVYPDSLSINKISSAINQVYSDGRIKDKILELKKIAENFNGIQNTVDIINNIKVV